MPPYYKRIRLVSEQKILYKEHPTAYQLFEARLPRILRLTLCDGDKLEAVLVVGLADGVEERLLVLKEIGVERSPQLAVVGDLEEASADLRHPTQIRLVEVAEDGEEDLVGQFADHVKG